MNAAVLQPPYPAAGTVSAAETCLCWMRERLAACAHQLLAGAFAPREWVP